MGTKGSFSREFLVACLLHLAILAWVFRAPFLTGNIPFYGMGDSPLKVVESVSEDQFLLADHYAIASQLRFGHFPSWFPHGEAGNPLLGKTSEGVFSPTHLPLYLTPLSWLPHLLALVVVLRIFLAFAFTYLYSRSLELSPKGAFLAGNLFAFHWVTFVGAHYSAVGSAIYLPLLLLLIELYFRESRRALALFFLPWAMAFPYWAGHFENSTRVCGLAAVYFIARLVQTVGPDPKKLLHHGLIFGGLSLAGAGLASGQLVAGWEYIQSSFNKVWRTAFAFEWQYGIISKRLGPGDMPHLIGGFLSFGVFSIFIRKTAGEGSAGDLKSLTRALGAALFLAFGIAFLANVGLECSLGPFAFRRDLSNALGWLPGFFILILAFWEWRKEGNSPGMTVLGGLAAAGVLLVLKTPVLANVLAHLPIVKLTNGPVFHFEIALGAAVLCSAALSRLAERPEERLRRAAHALGLLRALGILIIGYCLSQPLKGFLADTIPTSATQAGAEARDGGLLGPEREFPAGNAYTVRGWAPTSSGVKSVAVGIRHPGDELNSIRSQIRVSRLRPDRTYFKGRVILPAPSIRWRVVAQVDRQDGTRRTYGGPEIEWRPRGREPWTSICLVAGLLLLPLLLLHGRVLSPVLYAGLLAGCASMGSLLISTAPAWPFPHPLPGAAKMAREGGLARIYSPTKGFLPPDYSSLYGLDDIRMSADNLNVLSTRHFNSMAASLLDEGVPSVRDAGLKLLGLANVRYWIDSSRAKHEHPALLPFYRGEDMAVYENRHFRPRARFFNGYLVQDIVGWRNWEKSSDLLSPLVNALKGGQLDPDKILVLHEKPVWAKEQNSEPSSSTAPMVRVSEYLPYRVRVEVDTPRRGFIFLSDAFFPGWRAYINGKPAPIMRSWVAFRAVPVRPGRFRLEFRYEPMALRLCVLLGIALVLGWVVLYLRRLLGRRRAESGEDAIGECARVAEVLLLTMIVPWILYWLAWGLFVYKGGL